MPYAAFVRAEAGGPALGLERLIALSARDLHGTHLAIPAIILLCYHSCMSTQPDQRRNPLGAIGDTVRANVARLRGGMQYKELSERLADLGRPIPTLGLRRIEDGNRRVDAGDLVALAVALDTTPTALLLPHVDDGDAISLTAHHEVSVGAAWEWALGKHPLGDSDRAAHARFIDRSSPRSISVP